VTTTIDTYVDVGDAQVLLGTDDEGRFVRTTFADGTNVLARPVDEAWEQTRLHDLLHSLIAEARGEPHSPSLWNVAHPDGPRYDLPTVRSDEARVLAAQEAITEALAA
jgi:hypothetical protein